jgi:predicted AlkP superfamily phosphohydrolase/phosphomutase
MTHGPVFFFGEWLVREGYLKLKEEFAARGQREQLGFALRESMKRLGLSRLKKGLPQFVRNLLPSGIQYPAFMSVDYGRTKAFLGPGEFCDLFLNLQGRETQGTIASSDLNDELVTMAARLKQASDIHSYSPICLNPSSDVYHGDHLDKLPDAVITDPGSWHLEPGLHPNGPIGSVDVKHEHNQHGVLLFSGSDIQPAGTEHPATLVDVLPTSLLLAEQKIPQGLDGQCLLESSQGSPPEYYRSVLELDKDVPQEQVSDEEEAEVMERLRKLGYL